MNHIKRTLIAILTAASLIATGGVTACSSAPPPPMPNTYTIAYGGTTYCGYEYDPYEIDMYGQFPGYDTCTRVAFPSLSIVPTTGLQIALMNYWTMYAGFYESGWWYDTYYAPIGPRYHVTVISRTSYMSNVSTFDRTYSSQIKTNSPKATWSNGTPGTYKFPTSNQKVKTQTNSSTTNYGSGTDNSHSVTRTTTGGGGTTGKSGSSRSGGRR